MLKHRHAKIVATLGPACNTDEIIEQLFLQGVDVFRLNFSHGDHADHQRRLNCIRTLEKKYNRPIAIMADLQGPKLRISTFEDNQIYLQPGKTFRLDQDSTPGNGERVCLPHPQIFKALEIGAELLLDDGKIVIKVVSFDDDHAICDVIVGGILSNRKGVNVPGVKLPISPITEKDFKDLDFALSLGVDYIALSFVQSPHDVKLARDYIDNRAAIISKLEKPLALQHLEEIIELSDGIMVARGDLGVELPAEDVPSIQRQIIRKCRQAGKPVIVATQMLESMISNATPTRAEASDVATAIYDGVDAVMLSAESASGQYPIEAVKMMSRIICKTESDPLYIQTRLDENIIRPHTVTDSIAAAAHQVSKTIDVDCIVTFSESGFTALRVARERPLTTILSLTPKVRVARRLTLVWGVQGHLVNLVYNFSQMVTIACGKAVALKVAEVNDKIIVTAGIPFGEAGGTNILQVVTIQQDEINAHTQLTNESLSQELES